jgi:hypothetical protein
MAGTEGRTASFVELESTQQVGVTPRNRLAGFSQMVDRIGRGSAAMRSGGPGEKGLLSVL